MVVVVVRGMVVVVVEAEAQNKNSECGRTQDRNVQSFLLGRWTW